MNWWIFSIIIITILVIIGIFVYAINYPSAQFFGKVIFKHNSRGALLTFDDGPDENTSEILDILKEENVSAIFFLIGDKARTYPDVVKRIIAEGHTIGVHSMTHSRLWKNNYKEIVDTKLLLEGLSKKPVKYFRPPYGFRIKNTLDVAKHVNLTTMTWNVFPRDYKTNASEIYDNVLKNTRDGSIVCLHDGTSNSFETVVALPNIIVDLKKKGIWFVRPDKLKFD